MWIVLQTSQCMFGDFYLYNVRLLRIKYNYNSANRIILVTLLPTPMHSNSSNE